MKTRTFHALRATLLRVAARPAKCSGATRRSEWMLGLLTAMALVGCATQPQTAAAPGKVTPQLRSGSNELRTYSVDAWIAPDDHTLILNAVDRSLFEARFKNQCTGLRLVNTIAFIVPTGQGLEKYEGIVLPDGKRCPFTSMTRVDTSQPPGKDTTANSKP